MYTRTPSWNLTIPETEVMLKLTAMKERNSYIALQLHPAIGSTIICEEGNRLFINEGRDGKWNDISESFYDAIVEKFDSRS
jgi:hypothetical protein